MAVPRASAHGRNHGGARALILTYHAIEDAPSPLCVTPPLFRAQLDCIVESGAQTLTVRDLAAAIRDGTLPDRAVVITFDDAFRSATHIGAPLLEERGLRATFFCVAGYAGRTNSWPTQPADATRLPLATAADLRALARAGFEIGAHGMTHLPLAAAEPHELHQELIEAKATLAELSGSEVTSLAYPYGVRPGAEGRRIAEATYSAACLSVIAEVRANTPLHELPRVDIHYLRNVKLLRRALADSPGRYLAARRFGARVRRVLVKDHARP